MRQQVEHFDDSTSGEVVRWNKWIRLRNMCTKRYLRIKQTGTDSYVVSTTLSGKDPSCRFSFHPVTRESVEVPYPCTKLSTKAGGNVKSFNSLPKQRSVAFNTF